MIARVLVIAGSDSGGGAGIQADIKTITMLGAHAMTAITAITAQNTLGVQRVMPVPADMVIAQIDSVMADIGVDAVKIGMIGTAETAHAVADRLAGIGVPIVLDPVMVATSGATLADADTIAAFERLMRIATVVTPNRADTETLGGEAAIRALGPAVVVKGGHLDDDGIGDRLIDAHGVGCTLASGIATGLAQGLSLHDAVERARAFVRIVLHEAPGIGGGNGPMGHGRVRLDGIDRGVVLNQITLPARDHELSVAFYRALGLTQIVAAEGRYTRFETAGGTTLSIEAADEIDGAAVTFLECDDLDATIARARGAGIAVGDPVEQPWGWREARLVDPAGNALRLYRAGEMRRFPPWRLRDA